MENLKVSIVIPVYNGAAYIGEAIESVLEQTYQNYELILVDDASTDRSMEVIAEFDDSRIIYIRNESNQGSNVTRNTGIKAATGDLISFLDQDDFFHPEKLQAHIDYYKRNPEVCFTYNSRFELEYGSRDIRSIWRPPHTLTPADFLLSFPIAPSDMVFKRDWADRMGLLVDRVHFYGGEYVLLGRLYIQGCVFGHVDRALNYRRRHPGRVIRDINKGLESELAAQDIVFADPDCPEEILDLKHLARAHAYLGWGYLALFQGETRAGQEYWQKAVDLNPQLVSEEPCSLLEHIVYHSVEDKSNKPEVVVSGIFSQLPTDLDWLQPKLDWAIGRSYLIKGFRAVIWGGEGSGAEEIMKANSYGATVENSLIQMITDELANFEHEFGFESTQPVLGRLSNMMSLAGTNGSASSFEGNFYLNRAFDRYRSGMESQVPYLVFTAFRHNPELLSNRGASSILVRSILKSVGLLRNNTSP